MQSGSTDTDELWEVAMLTAVSMATVCTLGVAFYARFLFAMCKECRHQRICYLVCVQTHSLEEAVPDDRLLDHPFPAPPDVQSLRFAEWYEDSDYK